MLHVLLAVFPTNSNFRTGMRGHVFRMTLCNEEKLADKHDNPQSEVYASPRVVKYLPKHVPNTISLM